MDSYNIDTFNTWKVWTEGDVEGRTRQALGVFQGHIDDIALNLKNQCYYSLHFEVFNPEIEFDLEPQEGSVSVVIPMLSKQMDKNKVDTERMKETFKGRPVEISESNYFMSFTITSKPSEQMIKERALAKLTNEEREVLGI